MTGIVRLGSRGLINRSLFVIRLCVCVLGLVAYSTEALAESELDRSTVGVCIRWTTDQHHVASVVVADSSGDPELDNLVRSAVEQMTWERPAEYRGQSIGIVIAVNGGRPTKAAPDCSTIDIGPPESPRRHRIRGRVTGRIMVTVHSVDP